MFSQFYYYYYYCDKTNCENNIETDDRHSSLAINIKLKYHYYCYNTSYNDEKCHLATSCMVKYNNDILSLHVMIDLKCPNNAGGMPH